MARKWKPKQHRYIGKLKKSYNRWNVTDARNDEFNKLKRYYSGHWNSNVRHNQKSNKWYTYEPPRHHKGARRRGIAEDETYHHTWHPRRF